MQEPESAPRRLRDPHPCLKRGPGWLIFAIGLIGTFSASYPHGCLNVLLPSISLELGVDTSLIVIVNIIYSLISGVLTLPFGRWGDRIGYQKLFLMGQTVLLAASTLSAFLTVDFATLILFRCMLAVGAAMVLSVVQAMLSQAFPGVRGRMMGLYSMSVSYSGAFAPLQLTASRPQVPVAQTEKPSSPWRMVCRARVMKGSSSTITSRISLLIRPPSEWLKRCESLSHLKNECCRKAAPPAGAYFSGPGLPGRKTCLRRGRFRRGKTRGPARYPLYSFAKELGAQ